LALTCPACIEVGSAGCFSGGVRIPEDTVVHLHSFCCRQLSVVTVSKTGKVLRPRHHAKFSYLLGAAKMKTEIYSLRDAQKRGIQPDF
jgi:hypothetical protein